MADRADIAMSDGPPLHGSATNAQSNSSIDSTHDLNMQGARSSAATSSAITPFLDRPPEIRNAIYEALFERDEPILLVVKPDVKMNELSLRRAFMDKEFLFTRKQIYAEACDVIISHNTWLLSFGSEPGAYDLIEKVGELFANMGDRKALLRRTQIDLQSDATYQDPDELNGVINIRPLVQHAFSELHRARLVVTFVPPKDSHAAITRVIDYEAVNKTLNSLMTAAPPDLQKYLRCKKLLRSVLISESKTVRVLFWGGGAQVTYEMDANDRLIRPPHSSRPINLHRLLEVHNVSKGIFKTFINPEIRFTSDLSQSTISCSLPGAMHVDRRVRHAAVRSLACDVEAVITVEHGDDSMFSRLFDFVWEDSPLQCFVNDSLDPVRDARLRIEVVLPEQTAVEDVRLDAIEFQRAAHWIHGEAELCIGLRKGLKLLPGHKLTVTQADLRYRLLEFLADLIEMLPDRHLLPCPTIWMDHQGRMREACFRVHNNVGLVVRNNLRGLEVQPSPRDRRRYVNQIRERCDDVQNATGYNTSLLGCAVHHASMLLEWAESENDD